VQSVQSTFNVGQMLSLQGIALINGTQMITALTVEGKLLAEVFSRFNDAVSCQRAEKKNCDLQFSSKHLVMSSNLKRYKIGIAYRPGRPHIGEKWGKLTPLEKWMKN